MRTTTAATSLQLILLLAGGLCGGLDLTGQWKEDKGLRTGLSDFLYNAGGFGFLSRTREQL